MTNAMTNYERAKVSTKFTFKNEQLNAYSTELAKALNAGIAAVDTARGKVEDVTRKQAEILGLVLDTKCYEEDGFTSVQDYAKKVFDIESAYAAKLAQAGKRFYNADTETAKRIVEAYGSQPSKLFEVMALDDSTIDNMKLTGNETSKELREKAKQAKASNKKPDIVHNYNVQAHWSLSNEDGKITTIEDIFNSVSALNPKEAVTEYLEKMNTVYTSGTWEVFKTKVEHENGDIVFVCINALGDVWARVQVHKVAEKKQSKGKKRTFNISELPIEELAKMLDMTVEQAKTLVKKISG